MPTQAVLKVSLLLVGALLSDVYGPPKISAVGIAVDVATNTCTLTVTEHAEVIATDAADHPTVRPERGDGSVVVTGCLAKLGTLVAGSCFTPGARPTSWPIPGGLPECDP